MPKTTPNTFSAFLARFAADTRGSFALMMSFALIALFAAVGLSIDAHNLYKTRQDLQAALDGATLLVAKERLTDDAQIKARIEEYLATRPELPGVTVDSVSRTGNSYSASASLIEDTLFMFTVGIDEAKVAASASTTFDMRGLNLALVLDTTGSMRGRKIATLKEAAGDLIDGLESMNSNVIRASVVPFAQYVNVDASNRNAGWLDIDPGLRASWNGCVGSVAAPFHLQAQTRTRRVPAVAGNYCGAPLQPLTANMGDVRAAVDAMDARGWTYIPSGISWGWRSLTPEAPLRSSNNAASRGADNVMVVMTDGANTRAKSGPTHNSASRADADADTAALCTNAKADGIIIYTISYEITDAATRNLMRDCASSASNNFNADNAAQLRTAFNSIGQSVLSLRLTN